MADWRKAIAFTMHQEDRSGSGKVIVDAGGVTKWGISERGNPQLTVDQIKNLTKAEAEDIYKKKYWRSDFDNLPDKLATTLFDINVNSGTEGMAWITQRAIGDHTLALNKGKVDGLWGPKTKASLDDALKQKGQAALAMDIVQARVAFQHMLTMQEKKDKQGRAIPREGPEPNTERWNGWVRRNEDLAKYILK